MKIHVVTPYINEKLTLSNFLLRQLNPSSYDHSGTLETLAGTIEKQQEFICDFVAMLIEKKVISLDDLDSMFDDTTLTRLED